MARNPNMFFVKNDTKKCFKDPKMVIKKRQAVMLPTEATKYDENDVVDTQVPDTLSYL
jgi:hypothetical protein